MGLGRFEGPVLKCLFEALQSPRWKMVQDLFPRSVASRTFYVIVEARCNYEWLQNDLTIYLKVSTDRTAAQ